MHGFCRNFQHYTGFVYYLFFSFQWVLSFLYVYSDHSILECYNLFSGVELSMRSFFVIYENLLSPASVHPGTSLTAERLIDSFSQDIMYAVSKGEFLTMKHASVGLGLHSLTGQKLPLQVLSRLGHSMTYDQICEVETAQAELHGTTFKIIVLTLTYMSH